MGQKFFISFNAADKTKAHWIAWTLKEAGYEVAVYDWELPAGGNVPLWMNAKLAWADRLIAVISPDYLPAHYSPVEWASQIWNDPDGTKGAVIPVVVRPTPNIPPLLNDLSRIDLTNCSEAEAKSRLLKGVDMPAPPELKPEFEQIVAEAPDSKHAGPVEKPIFVRGNVEGGLAESTAPKSKGWIQRWTGRIAALTALLVAAATLVDAAIALVNKTTPLACSLEILLPWCKAPSEPAQNHILANIVRASRSLPLDDSIAGSIYQQGKLTPISPKVMALLIVNHPRELVFFAVISGIKLTGHEKDTKNQVAYYFQNDPADDRINGIQAYDQCETILDRTPVGTGIYNDDSTCNFSKFSNILGLMIEFGLTSELTTNGGHFCWDPALALPKYKSIVLTETTNVCGKPGAFQMNFGKIIFQDVEIVVRSTDAIYQYLGKLLRDNSASLLNPGFVSSSYKADGPLLNIAIMSGEKSTGCIISESVGKEFYCVPHDGGGNTVKLISILEELRNLSMPEKN